MKSFRIGFAEVVNILSV